MSKRAIEIFDNLKTPHIEIAKHCLFSYSILFNKEIEPNFCYDDKFFTILSYSFQKFLKSNNRLFMLEASPRTGKTDFLINIVLVSLIGNLKNNSIEEILNNPKLVEIRDNLIKDQPDKNCQKCQSLENVSNSYEHKHFRELYNIKKVYENIL